MKKLIAAVIVVIIVVVGTFAVLHKPSNLTTSATISPVPSASPPIVNNLVLMTKSTRTVGSYLADPAGKTLYFYNADSSGVSNCLASCLANWPAYQATDPTSKLPTGIGTIKRSDSDALQYTYRGKPLYYFVNDAQGQVTGNGIGNFTVAKPFSTPQPTATPSTIPVTSSRSPY
ncbi:MAG: hypothetical protein ABI602_02645 [Candidatus Saccharibacteria bacterium]